MGYDDEDFEPDNSDIDRAERKRWLSIAAAFTLLLLTAGLVWLFMQDSESDERDAVIAKRQAQVEKYNLARQVASACADQSTSGMDEATYARLCSDAATIVREGPQGAQGIPGPMGPQGTQGIQGPMGFQGIPGVDGKDGKDGALGPPGPAGENGKDGVDGKDGATGPAGPAGADGKDGATGPAGPAGVGIGSIVCEGLQSAKFTFTMSDGSVKVVECNGLPVEP